MIVWSEPYARAFAEVALANVEREYPRRIDHLLVAPPGDLTPRRVHPAFFGSYDWHSAVHMHWLLARVLRTFPEVPQAARIRRLFDAHFTPERMATERAYLELPSARTFERPYGWAWLLELSAELGELQDRRWSDSLAPLAQLLVARFRSQVAAAPYPVRSGSHGNTAFAALLALDYARRTVDRDLAEDITRAAQRWYAADRGAPVAFEPSLDDFLSPALVEAALMRAILPAVAFANWLAAFLPEDLGPLATPPVVADRRDPKQSHLDGLALSRAWCLRRLADALPVTDARRAHFVELVDRHLEAALSQVVGGEYVGEHWLASFAALAMGECP